MIRFACSSLLFLGDAAAAAYSSAELSAGTVFLAALGAVALMAPDVVRWVDRFLESETLES